MSKLSLLPDFGWTWVTSTILRFIRLPLNKRLIGFVIFLVLISICEGAKDLDKQSAPSIKKDPELAPIPKSYTPPESHVHASKVKSKSKSKGQGQGHKKPKLLSEHQHPDQIQAIDIPESNDKSTATPLKLIKDSIKSLLNYDINDILNLLGKGDLMESGRTLLFAPLMAAAPMMLAEVMAVGGMGMAAPGLIILPLVLIPLILVAFIIYI